MLIMRWICKLLLADVSIKLTEKSCLTEKVPVHVLLKQKNNGAKEIRFCKVFKSLCFQQSSSILWQKLPSP